MSVAFGFWGKGKNSRDLRISNEAIELLWVGKTGVLDEQSIARSSVYWLLANDFANKSLSLVFLLVSQKMDRGIRGASEVSSGLQGQISWRQQLFKNRACFFKDMQLGVEKTRSAMYNSTASISK